MDPVTETLAWNFDRRFGVEIEVNAFDGKSRPDHKDEAPRGIERIAQIVHETTSQPVRVEKWGLSHNNSGWIVKPDGSCGMEVCTPILKGWRGLEDVLRVVDRFGGDGKVRADRRCSYHVHVNVADLDRAQVASVVAHWVKCEAVFLDSVPASRKRSRYCQVIGMCDMFDHREVPDVSRILDRLGRVKYFSMNNLHYAKDKRKTVESRIAEHDFCTNAVHAKNWTRLMVLFVERASRLPLPKPYEPGDPWSGLCWLDPVDVFKLLQFSPGEPLSPGLSQTREWFLGRLTANTLCGPETGAFSPLARRAAYREATELVAALHDRGEPVDPYALFPPDRQRALYDPSLRI